MTMSGTTGPDGKRDDEEGTGAGEESASGADKAEEAGSEEPIELTEEAQLDLEDDDPPLPWLQGDSDENELEGTGTGQTIGFILLGLLAIVLVVGGIWWVTRKSSDDVLVADGGTVAAPDQPYKQRPDRKSVV